MSKKSAQPFGRLLQLVLVVAENEIVEDGADAAGVDRRRDIGGLAADLGIVELLEQAFLAADREFVALDLDDVPGGGATLHLGAQHADAAVPGLVVHRDAGCFLERLEIDLLLGILIGAAPRHDGEVTRLRDRGQRGAGG